MESHEKCRNRRLSICLMACLLALGAGSCEQRLGKAAKVGKPVPMLTDAKKVLADFRSSLSVADWTRALSLCTQAVREQANKSPSAAEFCRAVLPVEEITTAKTLRTHARISRDSTREIVGYRWVVSVKNADDVYWFCEIRKIDAQWRLDFPDEPLAQYVDRIHTERRLRAEESQRRRKILLPKLETVTLKLTAVKPSFALGEPMPFRLEMTNGGQETLYYDRQQTDINQSMVVTDSRGRSIAYTAGSFQTAGGYRPIEASQTVVLFDDLDLASQYKIDRLGIYTVQFSGKGLSVGDRQPNDSTEYGENNPSFVLSGTCASDTVQIEVLRGGGVVMQDKSAEPRR